MSKKARRTAKSNPMQTIFTRFMLIVLFFVVWIGGIGVRLVHLQVKQHEELYSRALGQRRDTVREKQLRGTIFDRSDRALAMSVKVKSLYADPTEITDLDRTAADVARALKVKPSEIAKKLREAREAGRRYVVLAPKLDSDAVEAINDSLADKQLKKADEPRYQGLHWKETEKRSYPYGTLAAHVLGFANAEDVGSAGIEQSEEASLRGAFVRGFQDRDRLGRVYEETETERREPPKDVRLTISHSIQYKVEQALEEGVKAARAKSGTAIVMVPATGEILAMANYPTFDPNRYSEFASALYVNRAVQDVYSPGSVFKVVTYGAALNEGSINPAGRVSCGDGTLAIPGRKIVDKHCTNQMSYDTAMAVSSNIAAMKTAIGVGREKFDFYTRRFGFGTAAGIGLPAESRGILRPVSAWNSDSLASLSIGYEIGVSALQMTSAFATIANDGFRVQPHIIKEIRHADGKVVSTTEATKTQVVTAETARSLRRMLREVVVSGTGKRARLNGYTSAGKTGTAWKYDSKLKRFNEQRFVSSFIGFAPAENPEIVISVVLDEPQVAARDGGQVSAPIFREIAEQVLPELNVVPDSDIRPEFVADEELPSESDVPARPGPAPDSERDPVRTVNDAANGPKAAEKPKQVADKRDRPKSKNTDGPRGKT